MTIFLFLFSIGVVCFQVCFADDPCQTYRNFTDEDRRDALYHLGPSEEPVSDKYITEGWYGSLMNFTTTAPGIYKCGAYFPIWAKQEVAVDDGTVDISMCTQIPDNDCVESFIVKAKDCGSYKVYNLKRTGPDSAYCFAAKYGAVPEEIKEPVVDIDLIKVDGVASELKFRCIFNQSAEDVFYKVYWYIDNKYFYSSKPHEWAARNENNALDETTLQQNGCRNVYCSVRASNYEDSAANRPTFSSVKFGAIKLYNRKVYLETEPAEIYLQLTAPFECTSNTNCSLNIQLLEKDDIRDENCERKSLVLSHCGLEIERNKWNKVHSFTVKPRTNVKEYGSKTSTTTMKLAIAPRSRTNGFLCNYSNLENIVVERSETTAMIEGKQCSATSNAHMKTLDGRYYEHQSEGIFTLYANLEHQVEVQVETASCNRAFCVCGLTVRAGKSVFAIPLCRGLQPPAFLSDDYEDILDIRRNKLLYEILIPTGAIVKVNLLNYGGYFMNVYVVPSIHDIDKSRGLCGKLSDTDTDDFVKRDGTQSGSDSEFSESWRVVDANNLFDMNTLQTLKHWGDSKNYCSCPKCDTLPCGEVECGPMQEAKACPKYRPPETARVKPRQRCRASTRKRRSVVERTHNSQQISVVKRDTQDWLNGWTKETATKFCQTHFDASRSAQVCRDIPTVNITKNIEDCVFDIWASGGTEFFDAALDNMQTGCMQEVVMNSSFHVETGGESVIDKVFKVACPNGCRRKGDCVNGECKCNADYGGSDCSVDLNSAPVVTEVHCEGLLDVNDESCTAVSVFGGTFVNSSKTTCKFRDIGDDSYGPAVVTATFENLFELSCPMPLYRTKRSTLGVPADEKPRAYNVSVSNNGVTYSEEKIVVIYDSACQNCTLSGTSVSCVISDNYCTLGPKCIPDGGRSPDGSCLMCEIKGKEKMWQEDITCSCIRVSVPWIFVMFLAFIAYIL